MKVYSTFICNCSECPNIENDKYCLELEREVSPLDIPDDCPLEDC